MLFLATAVHIVDLVSNVFVRTFAAIELIPLPIRSEKPIIAIPAVEDVLARASFQLSVGASFRQVIVAGPTVEYVVSLFADHIVVARSAVKDVAALAA